MEAKPPLQFLAKSSAPWSRSQAGPIKGPNRDREANRGDEKRWERVATFESIYKNGQSEWETFRGVRDEIWSRGESKE